MAAEPDAARADTPPPYYDLNAPDHLVDASGAYRLTLKPDGTVELRHNGNHAAWIVGP